MEEPMSAASRSIQAGASKRRVNFAAFALLLAVAVLVIVAAGQITASRQPDAPAAGFAPVMHDHGWATAASGIAADSAGGVTAPVMIDHGWASAASGIPAVSTWTVDPNSKANDAARHRPRRPGVANPFLGGGQPAGGPDSYAGARKAQ
jgi:hypothetical protein